MRQRITRLWNSPRRWIILLVGVLIVIVVGGIIFLLVRFNQAATPRIPSAFYTPPDPLPQSEPGTIIRYEPLPDNLPEGAQAWRVMYLSTGLNGEPSAVTGTIVAPVGTGNTPRDIIAWTHGTTGIRPACGVSHTDDPYQQTPAIERMIGAGYVVTITDYPGLGTPGMHPYMVGRVAAQSALDSVRAARSIPEISAGSRFVVWGASQGGNAALWTGQIAEAYAPELELLGVAASAPAIDLRAMFEHNFDEPAGGIFLGMVLAAWEQVYADRGTNLDAVIKPEERENFNRMIEPCFTAAAGFLRVLGQIRTPQQYLAVDLLNMEPWSVLLEENAPTDPIPVPIIIAHGTDDPLIPVENSAAEAARHCATGEDVQFQRYPGSTHDAREDTAFHILGWVSDRFAGRPTSSNCDV